ncbi:ABC transporter permease [Patescibacteria group bacterium]|nr:ABC transporter permease [Patescibacteria group bacterium]
MLWLSAIRVLKMGLKNFWRNFWISFATTGIMALTIFSVVVLIILNFIGDSALRSLEQKIDVSVYFKSDVSNEQVQPIREHLDTIPEVKETRYVTKKEALEEFQRKHSDNPLIIASLSELEENPLQPTLVIKARSPEDFSAISSVLKDDQYEGIIEKFNYEDNQIIIEKLNQTIALIEKIGIGVSITFAIISVLVMFNTIRLTIYTQKDEIGVMRLVGASNTFITAPYIIEGVLYGFFATIFSTVTLYILVKYLAPAINTFLEHQVDVYAFFMDHLFLIVIGELVFGAALGIASSMIAIRKYLKI